MDLCLVDTESLSVQVAIDLNITVRKDGLLVFKKETAGTILCLKATIGKNIQEPFAVSYCESVSMLVLCCIQCSFLIDCSLIHEYWLQNKKEDQVLMLPYIGHCFR